MTSDRGDRDRGERGGDRGDRGDDRGPRRSGGGDRGDRGGGGGGGGRFRRPRGCEFCRGKVDVVDYKDTQILRRYITERGKMEPRRKVGTCAKHQRTVSQAIKRARHLALIPYTSEHIRLAGGAGRR